MKKFTFLFAILMIASFSFLKSQNIVVQDDVVTFTSIGDAADLQSPATRGEYELKYYEVDHDHFTMLGGTNQTGTFYCSGCISFTSEQMQQYVGMDFIRIKVYMPAANYLPNLDPSFSRVWIKGALNGPVIYEQLFTAKLGSWNEIILTTPQKIAAGPFAIGYTLLSVPSGQDIRPWALSTKDENPYVPGGINYVRNANANNYKDGATWSQYTAQGNLALIGYAMSSTPPPVCNPVTNTDVTFRGCSKATVTWTAVEGAKEYKVSRNGNTATVTNPPYEEEGEFDAEITYTWEIVTVCETNESTPVSVSGTGCVGINGFAKNTFTIVPNPATLNIEITADNIFNTIEVLNFLGQIVSSQSNDQNKATLDVSNLSKGVYFVRIISNTGTSVQKFVKQ